MKLLKLMSAGVFGTLFVVAGQLPAQGQSGSYELLAVVDQSNRVIRRFDPISGNSLGTFGSGYLTSPSGIQLRNGLAYVLDHSGAAALGNARVKVFNYSTGLFLQSSPLSAAWGFAWNDSTLKLEGTSYAVSDANPFNGSSYVTVYDSSGNPLVYQGGVNAPSPVIYSSELSANGLIRYRSFNGSIAWLTSSQTTFSNALTGTVVSAGINSQLLRVDSTLYALNSTNSLIRRFSIAGNGALSETGTIALPGFQANSLRGLARGHGNTLYVSGQDGTTVTSARILKLDGLTGDLYNAITLPGVGAVRSMDTVIAPEPGTLLAMGVGLAALARRRRAGRGRVEKANQGGQA